MIKKKNLSTIIAITAFIGLIGAVLFLGRIENRLDNKIIETGKESTGTVSKIGKRIVRLTYLVDNVKYESGVGLPSSDLKVGDQFKLKYLESNPKSIYVFFDSPITKE